ncbi:MAG: mannose-1-phosphate guanylyltransferase [Microscillaceae bacterium]|jgi:mannose-1-phosphate guanylyltransferase|nr:mannose-1-phosphate guanylyltransferase [Microscillaceae bacterium]
MVNKDNYVVIMAGGVGTRLWPFSRNSRPKQFHDLLGVGSSLLQQSVSRFSDICPFENIYIVTNEMYYGLVKEQLPHLNDHQILLEPMMRNTAPCVAYASYKILKQNPQANIVVSPADQVIRQEGLFQQTILKALADTQKSEHLVTLGIKPTRPDTGYGYIQFFEEDIDEVKRVKMFLEKPELEMAKQFLASGDFVWNAGIFVWNVQTIVKAFQNYMPEVADIFADAQKDFYTDKELNTIKKAYSICPSKSIDHGIMEKAYQDEMVYVVLSEFDWSDLGTWKSLYEESEKNEDKNVITGNVMAYEVKNCIIKTSKDKLVVVQGLEDYIVAEFDDVVLICKKDEEQKVKDFVADAKSKGAKFV